jgi:hypothetical protein
MKIARSTVFAYSILYAISMLFLIILIIHKYNLSLVWLIIPHSFSMLIPFFWGKTVYLNRQQTVEQVLKNSDSSSVIALFCCSMAATWLFALMPEQKWVEYLTLASISIAMVHIFTAFMRLGYRSAERKHSS